MDLSRRKKKMGKKGEYKWKKKKKMRRERERRRSHHNSCRPMLRHFSSSRARKGGDQFLKTFFRFFAEIGNEESCLAFFLSVRPDFKSFSLFFASGGDFKSTPLPPPQAHDHHPTPKRERREEGRMESG